MKPVAERLPVLLLGRRRARQADVVRALESTDASSADDHLHRGPHLREPVDGDYACRDTLA